MTATNNTPRTWPTKPCGECPFTTNGITLHPGRAKELSAMATDDHANFHCHKTLDVDPAHRAGCAGYNILCMRTRGTVGQTARFAHRLGLLNLTALEAEDARPGCAVFKNAAAMRRAHRQAAK